MILFRPVGLDELGLVYDSGMRAFPRRLPEQPIFYPVLTAAYAREVARNWNAIQPPFAGYVTRFEVHDSYASTLTPREVGGRAHTEFWVPAEDLGAFNAAIVAPVTVGEAFFGEEFAGEIPASFGLKGQTAREQAKCLLLTLEYSGFDFWCEVAANHRAVFLNFPFWESREAEFFGLTADQHARLLDSVRRRWERLENGTALPNSTAA